MRSLHTSLLLCLLSIPSAISAQTPTHLWSQRFGAAGDDGAYGVATDDAGNLYVTGSFEGTVSFGGSSLVSAGSRDIFLAKYDVNGVHQWSHRFGGVSNDGGSKVEIDGAGNIVVLGGYRGTINLGGDDLTSVSSQFGSSTFLAKFDESGAHLWSRGFSSSVACVGMSIAANGAGDVAMSGYFGNTADFGGGPLVGDNLSPDIFIAKYGADGAHLWSKRFGSDDLDQGRAVAMDASGDVFATGKYTGTVDFGGGPLASDGFSMFLARFSATGDHIWSESFDGNGNAIGLDIVLDHSNGLIVATQGEPVLGGGAVVGTGARELFAKFDRQGNHVWTRLYDSVTSLSTAKSISLTSSGGIAIIGNFYDSVDIGGGPLVTLGGGDIYFAVYSATGEHLCSRRLGGIEGDQSGGVAVDPFDDVLAVGRFENSIDAGDGPLVSAGMGDAFFIKYRCEHPLPVLIQRFDAVARPGAVELHWEVWSDELVESYEIVRSEPSTMRSVVVTRGAFGPDSDSFIDTSVQPGRSYDYVLTLQANGETIARSPVASVTAPSFEASVGQNYPNPFNPTTTIDVTIAEQSAVVVEIYDARGARVASLNGGVLDAGTHRLEWDGTDETGKRVGSGVYFYRLEGAGALVSRKMVVLK